MKIDFIDVRKAYLHANVLREVFVELPEEDQEEGMCGMLQKSMYGTRDAAMNWERTYTEFLESVGFRQGRATPCAFMHTERDLRVVAHGVSHVKELDWLREKISERFEVKFRGRLGPEVGDDKSIGLLNRVISWTDAGIEYEPDQRHAELIIQQLGLKEGSKGVSSPGMPRPSKEEMAKKEAEGWDADLEGERATMYRSLVVRGNFLSQDRTDIQYAVKEACRGMSKPKVKDWMALERLGRYLQLNIFSAPLSYNLEC